MVGKSQVALQLPHVLEYKEIKLEYSSPRRVVEQDSFPERYLLNVSHLVGNWTQESEVDVSMKAYVAVEIG